MPVLKLMLMLMNFDEFPYEFIDYFPGGGTAAGDDRLWCIGLTFSSTPSSSFSFFKKIFFWSPYL